MPREQPAARAVAREEKVVAGDAFGAVHHGRRRGSAQFVQTVRRGGEQRSVAIAVDPPDRAGNAGDRLRDIRRGNAAHLLIDDVKTVRSAGVETAVDASHDVDRAFDAAARVEQRHRRCDVEACDCAVHRQPERAFAIGERAGDDVVGQSRRGVDELIGIAVRVDDEQPVLTRADDDAPVAKPTAAGDRFSAQPRRRRGSERHDSGGRERVQTVVARYDDYASVAAVDDEIDFAAGQRHRDDVRHRRIDFLESIRAGEVDSSADRVRAALPRVGDHARFVAGPEDDEAIGDEDEAVLAGGRDRVDVAEVARVRRQLADERAIRQLVVVGCCDETELTDTTDCDVAAIVTRDAERRGRIRQRQHPRVERRVVLILDDRPEVVQRMAQLPKILDVPLIADRPDDHLHVVRQVLVPNHEADRLSPLVGRHQVATPSVARDAADLERDASRSLGHDVLHGRVADRVRLGPKNAQPLPNLFGDSLVIHVFEEGHQHPADSAR